VVKLLLCDDRVDPADNDNYGMKLAAIQNYLEVAEMMMADPRVNPAASNNYAIHTASEYGYYSIVKLLIMDGMVNPVARKNSPITSRFRSRFVYARCKGRSICRRRISVLKSG
jgi:hypothetical protein